MWNRMVAARPAAVHDGTTGPQAAGTGAGRPWWHAGRFVVAIAILAGASAGAATASLITAINDDGHSSARSGLAQGGGLVPGFPEIIATANKSIVALNVYSETVGDSWSITEEGGGSGFVIGAGGFIATNAHVVAGGQRITVTLPDGAKLRATVVGVSTEHDLAVLHVDRDGLTPVTFGRSDSLRAGDFVVAIGHALDLGGRPTATLGIVSALDRAIKTDDGLRYTGLLQTDTAINAGDSGGLLVDGQGHVVGILAAGSTAGQNISFAIAIDDALPVLNRLLGVSK
ncbi:MAG: trypsin-like peptidase domain-containing protein [Chloroflexi bacterium]|nr:trypsin-like peptidase domain-containing protein [Chloroflexota bacterium]